MRSELVFVALDRIPNPFHLCHVVSKRVRNSIKANGLIIATINDVLTTCQEGDLVRIQTDKRLKTTENLVFNAVVGA